MLNRRGFCAALAGFMMAPKVPLGEEFVSTPITSKITNGWLVTTPGAIGLNGGDTKVYSCVTKFDGSEEYITYSLEMSDDKT